MTTRGMMKRFRLTPLANTAISSLLECRVPMAKDTENSRDMGNAKFTLVGR
jgi:hypothetical protein